jgi:hypothetical protein
LGVGLAKAERLGVNPDALVAIDTQCNFLVGGKLSKTIENPFPHIK